MFRTLLAPVACAAVISAGACASGGPASPHAVALAPDTQNDPRRLPRGCDFESPSDICSGSGNTMLAYGVAAGAAAIILFVVALASDGDEEDRRP